MAEIRWSLTAQQDLFDIEEFIARDSAVYAVRVVDRIIETVERLEAHPRSGRVVPEFGRDDLREVISGSYRIVYQLDLNDIHVVRVVHASRKLDHLVKGDNSAK